MRVLIIKTSSLGDIIHTLPALTDAQHHIPDISFDWVIEPAFAEIPRFHKAVKNIIPINLRYWRKNILGDFTTIKTEFLNFYHQLRTEKYDYIIDCQGLMKSGFITFLARGNIKSGYDKHSAWEPLACLSYNDKHAISPHHHAITRIRELFSKIFSYSPNPLVNYGIALKKIININLHYKNYIIFLHGTTRDNKCWPEEHWAVLITLIKHHNPDITLLLPWGNQTEKSRAEKLALNQPHVTVLPKLSLTELAQLLLHARVTIAVDTGLGHLAAALNSPTISLYGPTDPKLIGTVGQHQTHVKKNTMADILPVDTMDLIIKTD